MTRTGSSADEIVGELALAIKLRTALKMLADVIDPLPSVQPGARRGSLGELAAQVALQGAARS